MIPKECKRLAEVDFPIAVVSKHSAREKSIRHGHPSLIFHVRSNGLLSSSSLEITEKIMLAFSRYL